MEIFLIVWGSIVLGMFVWVADDIRQRLKQLQTTLEEFIEDVQE